MQTGCARRPGKHSPLPPLAEPVITFISLTPVSYADGSAGAARVRAGLASLDSRVSSDVGNAIAHLARASAYGHFTTGGMLERIELTLPPVFRPKVVPRS